MNIGSRRKFFSRIFLLVFTVFFALSHLTALAVVQYGYRWRNDDGTEATATNAAAENTIITGVSVGDDLRVRFSLSGGPTYVGSTFGFNSAYSITSEFSPSLAIDTANGYLYAVNAPHSTVNQPFRISKIRLSDFTKVDEGVVTDDSYIEMLTKVGRVFLDNTGTNLYIANKGNFSDHDTRALYKVRTSDLVTVDNLDLDPDPGTDDEEIYIAGYDSANNDLILSMYANWASEGVFKIDLDTFTQVASTSATTTYFNNGDVDNTGTWGYFYGNGKVSKYAISSLFENSSTTLSGGSSTEVDFDFADGYGYECVTFANPTVITQRVLSDLTASSTLTLNTGEGFCYDIAIDPANNLGYVMVRSGTELTSTAKLVKFSTASMTRLDAITFAYNEQGGSDIAIDTVNGKLYIANSPITTSSYYAGKIVKVDLATFTREGEIDLDEGIHIVGNSQQVFAIDPINGLGYINGFFSYHPSTTRSAIGKIDLSTRTLSSRLDLATTTYNDSEGVAIDTDDGFLYIMNSSFGASPSITKINLSSFATTAIAYFATTTTANNLLMDRANDVLYIIGTQSPARILKINANTLAMTDYLNIGGTGPFENSAVIDEEDGYIFSITSASPGVMKKIDLSTFTVSTSSTISGVNSINHVILDPVNDFAYLSSATMPARIHKIDMTDLSLDGTITLDASMNSIGSVTVDLNSQYGYFPVGSNSALTYKSNIIKVDLNDFTRNATLTTLPTVDNQAYGGSALTSWYQNKFYVVGTDYEQIMEYTTDQRLIPRLEYGEKVTTCSAITNWTKVPVTASSEHWQMNDSANITNSASTTDYAGLSNPSGKTFAEGNIMDTSNQTPPNYFTPANFIEVEYSITPTANAVDGTTYCFRTTSAGYTDWYTYSQYAEATLGSGGGGGGAGVTVAESGGSTAVEEGGATDTYTVVLDSAPIDDVTVFITAPSDLSLSATQLVFTTSNWSTPQTVTVTAVDDSTYEGTESATITHTAASNDNDYNGISISSVIVSITDNDTAPSSSSSSSSSSGSSRRNLIDDVLDLINPPGEEAYTAPVVSPPPSSPSVTVVYSDTLPSSAGVPKYSRQDEVQEPSQETGGQQNLQKLEPLEGTLNLGIFDFLGSMTSLFNWGSPGSNGLSIALVVLSIPLSLLLSRQGALALLFITRLGFRDVYTVLVRNFQNLMVFLGLRKKRKFWGTVYDSFTKLPLDPAIVELYDAQTGKLLETSITDITGHYGFLVQPGTFRMKANKTHYRFPAKDLHNASNDEIYDRLYYGDEFSITDPSQVVVPNIPMDPTAPDFNEMEKRRKGLVKVNPRAEWWKFLFMSAVFWLGWVWTVWGYVLVKTNLQLVWAVIYTLVGFLYLLQGKGRLWGRVYRGFDRKAIADAIVELSLPEVSQVVYAKAKTASDGKFFLRAEPGRYRYRIKRTNEAKETLVISEGMLEIGKVGAVNTDIIV